MHSPDAAYVSFVTAVIASVTAIVTLVRTVLEKPRSNSHVRKNSFFKKIFSVPRGTGKSLKKNEKHTAFIPQEISAGSYGRSSVIKALKDVDIVFTCVDNDHIHPSNLNRILGYYM